MNKRKAKKRRKQQEQYESQIGMEIIPKLPEFAENVGRVIADCFKQYCKIAYETLDRIKTMPDGEFEQFCQQLDLQQIAFARRIRMKGRDANEQEKTNT